MLEVIGRRITIQPAGAAITGGLGLVIWGLAGWAASTDTPLPSQPGYQLEWSLPLVAAFLALGVANAALLAAFMPLITWSIRGESYSFSREAVMTGVVERTMFTGLMALFIAAGRANIRLFQTGELIWALLILSGAYVIAKSVRTGVDKERTRPIIIESLWGSWASVGVALVSGWYFWKLHDTINVTIRF